LAVVEPKPASPPSILVVDDEESLRHSVSRALRREGYTVDAAATAGEAVERLGRRPFDAVVTDVRLPDLCGLDVLAACSRVRPGMPVIVMTGFGTMDTALEAMRRGARDFLEKPFPAERLLEAVRAGLEQPSRPGARTRLEVERRFSPSAYTPADEVARDLASPEQGTPSRRLPLHEATRRFQARYMESLLARTAGNVAAAARLARISRPKLHEKLVALGIDAGRFRALPAQA
jgi:DNA-binding NtrC family response regulator